MILSDEKIKRIVLYTMAFFIAVLLIMIFTGCISQPQREDYKAMPDECFLFADCIARNAKNPDKSICAELAKQCSNAFDEARRLKRLEYCRGEKKPGDMTERECRLWLKSGD